MTDDLKQTALAMIQGREYQGTHFVAWGHVLWVAEPVTRKLKWLASWGAPVAYRAGETDQERAILRILQDLAATAGLAMKLRDPVTEPIVEVKIDVEP